MKQTSNYLVTLVFSLSFVFVAGFAVPTIQAQVAHVCGCGDAKCGGCLKGRLFPAKQLSERIKPAKPCACESCQTKAILPSRSAVPSRVTSDILISTEYLPEVTTSVVAPCSCGKTNCGCKLRRQKLLKPKVSCPKCDCDFCELKVEKTTLEKSCYEVKQKEVCIPPVTLPWKKCCPPRKAKVRVVNVLGKKKYECPSCKYSWNVFEPEVPKNPESESKSSLLEADKSEGDKEELEPIKEVDPLQPSAPTINVPEPPKAKDLDLDKVPRPPVEDA
jgi:hypothetical protein